MNILEIQDVEQAAAEATRLDPQSAEAFILKGFALYCRATLDKAHRRAVRPEERLPQVRQRLQECVAAYDKAIELGTGHQNKEDLARWHANRSQVYAFWGQVLTEESAADEQNKQQRLAEAQAKLAAALQDAELAVKGAPENTVTRGTLGVVHHLYALHCLQVGSAADEHWQQAEAAFQKQREQNPALGHLNLGQLYAHRAVSREKQAPEESQQWMLKAKEELEQVLQADKANHDANFWLGYIAQRQKQWDTASLCLFAAVQEPKFLRYNVSRMASFIEDESLERILFAKVVDQRNPKPTELAPWRLMRASLRYAQVVSKRGKGKSPELADLDRLNECLNYTEQAATTEVFNPIVRCLALETGADAWLLIALVKEANLSRRKEALKKVGEQLRKLAREHARNAQNLDQRWADVCEARLQLAGENLSELTAADRRQLLDQATEAVTEAEKLTRDEKLKERTKKLKEEIAEARKKQQ